MEIDRLYDEILEKCITIDELEENINRKITEKLSSGNYNLEMFFYFLQYKNIDDIKYLYFDKEFIDIFNRDIAKCVKKDIDIYDVISDIYKQYSDKSSFKNNYYKIYDLIYDYDIDIITNFVSYDMVFHKFLEIFIDDVESYLENFIDKYKEKEDVIEKLLIIISSESSDYLKVFDKYIEYYEKYNKKLLEKILYRSMKNIIEKLINDEDIHLYYRNIKDNDKLNDLFVQHIGNKIRRNRFDKLDIIKDKYNRVFNDVIEYISFSKFPVIRKDFFNYLKPYIDNILFKEPRYLFRDMKLYNEMKIYQNKDIEIEVEIDFDDCKNFYKNMFEKYIKDNNISKKERYEILKDTKNGQYSYHNIFFYLSQHSYIDRYKYLYLSIIDSENILKNELENIVNRHKILNR